MGLFLVRGMLEVAKSKAASSLRPFSFFILNSSCYLEQIYLPKSSITSNLELTQAKNSGLIKIKKIIR